MSVADSCGASLTSRCFNGQRGCPVHPRTARVARKIPLSLVTGTADYGKDLAVRPQQEVKPKMIHHFDLYRCGWTAEESAVPWSDVQLWAEGAHAIDDPGAPIVQQVTLRPVYGHAAAWYQVRLVPQQAAEAGWCHWIAELAVNNALIDRVPLAWYIGTPADWPSGIARFREPAGPALPGRTLDQSKSTPRGVWVLAARRQH